MQPPRPADASWGPPGPSLAILDRGPWAGVHWPESRRPGSRVPRAGAPRAGGPESPGPAPPDAWVAPRLGPGPEPRRARGSKTGKQGGSAGPEDPARPRSVVPGAGAVFL